MTRALFVLSLLTACGPGPADLIAGDYVGDMFVSTADSDVDSSDFVLTLGAADGNTVEISGDGIATFSIDVMEVLGTVMQNLGETENTLLFDDPELAVIHLGDVESVDFFGTAVQ